MVSRVLYLAPDAETDLEGAWNYLAAEAGPDKADQLFIDLISRLRVLEEQPHLGRQRAEFGYGYRALMIDQYLVVYRLSSKAVEILRVLHGARDIENIMKKQ